MTLRILIVDDHDLVRNGMRDLIGSFADCEVVGEAVNGRHALAMAALLQPDIVLLDITMPVMNGLECLAELPSHAPAAKALMLSTHAGADMMRASKNAGAKGYVVKHTAPEELEPALAAVAQGQAYFPPSLGGL